MPVEIWDARRYTPEQVRSIGALVNQVWPKPNMNAADRAAQLLALRDQYADATDSWPRSLVIVEEGRVVAHAALLPRTIGTALGELSIAGLARVCTSAAVRGRGLGEQVTRAALGLIDAGEFDYALFQTNRRVQGFYEKLGAVLVKNPIVNSLGADPNANPFWDEIVMRYPSDEDWPGGTIDLRGPGY
ncbi:MAG TPA: GNAT family N-acetyltransferase [Lacipirellula sp.]